MFASLRSRLWLTYLLLSGVILAVVTLSLLIFLARNPRLAREAENNLKFAGNALQRESLSIPAGAGAEAIQQAVERADETLGVRVAVLTLDGAVVADSRQASQPSIPELPLRLLPPGQGQGGSLAAREVVEFTDSQGQTWLYNVRLGPNRSVLLVATPRPTSPFLNVFTDEFFPPIMRAGLIALVLSILLGAWIARSISAPLQTMSAAAKQIAEGERGRVHPEGPSEVRALAQSLNEMSEQVHSSRQSQRDFVANVSHELKTPITSIQGFAQAILDGTAKSGEALQQAARVIYDEAGRMHRLVIDLLELARLDAGGGSLKRESVDLRKLLAALARKFAPMAKAAGVNLRTDLADLPQLSADGDRLVQVFTNLTENAIKHTPQGGAVSITAARQDGAAQITVADTGPGIPPEEAARVFERFYQLDKARAKGPGRGVGLGLPIARQIVDAHGGSLTLESEPGQGSRFVVRLPLGGAK
jgi:signal transduction histidine kinase